MISRGALLVYVLLLLLQLIWHGFLPSPVGNENWVLAVIAALPLVLPLRGMFSGRLRSMIWGGFLAVLYFVIGVMEAWSNRDQMVPALAQITLSLSYCGLLVFKTRKQN